MSFGVLIVGISSVWMISEIALARLKRSTAGDNTVDKSSLRILWRTIGLSLILGIALSGLPVGRVMADQYPNAIAISGHVLILIGLAVRWIAIVSLRKYFTVDVSIAADHQLVESGIYKYVRHPAYTGSLISFLGLGLTFSNWLSTVAIFFPIMTAFIYRTKIEEQALVTFFGDRYVQYCARTKRFVPGIY